MAYGWSHVTSRLVYIILYRIDTHTNRYPTIDVVEWTVGEVDVYPRATVFMHVQ
jgi:hypothetical protein